MAELGENTLTADEQIAQRTGFTTSNVLKVLGAGLLGAAGPAGIAAASRANMAELSLREQIRVREQKDLQLQQQVKITSAQSYIDRINEIGVEGINALDPQAKQEVIKAYEDANITLGAPANTPFGAADDGTLSQFGSVTVDGQELAVAADNKGGVIFQEGPNKGQLVPGSVRSSFKPLKKPSSLVGDINVGIDMTKTTQSALEKTSVNATRGAQRLNDIRGKFKREFLTFSGKAKAAGLNLVEKFGGTLSPENEAFLTDITGFMSTSIRNINDYIKEVTGAQMSEFEAKRLRRGMPDPGDNIFTGMGPTKFMETLDTAYEELSLMNARALIMRQRGIEYDFNAPENKDKEGPITINQTKAIINKFGGDIVKGLMAGGMEEQEAIIEAEKMVIQEFGAL